MEQEQMSLTKSSVYFPHLFGTDNTKNEIKATSHLDYTSFVYSYYIEVSQLMEHSTYFIHKCHFIRQDSITQPVKTVV